MNRSLLESDQALQLENQLCFALHSTSLAMTKVYRPLLEPLGLTYPQYLVLLVLWQEDNVPVSDLGTKLFLDSGTLTPLLKRLEAAGLVTRTRDPEDERRVLVALTTEGRKLKAKARKIPSCVVSAAGCSVRELTELAHTLKVLREQLNRTH